MTIQNRTSRITHPLHIPCAILSLFQLVFGFLPGSLRPKCLGPLQCTVWVYQGSECREKDCCDMHDANNEVLHDFATIHCSFPGGTKNIIKQKHLYRYLKYQDSTYQIYSKIYLGVILTLTVTGWLLSLIAAKTLKLPGPEKLQSCWDDEGKTLLPTKLLKQIFEFEMTMITSHRRK